MEIAPVLLLIFNRPDVTRVVFQRIRESKPQKLFVAADGPRSLEESEICQQTRDLVLSHIDWDCEVKTLLREENLGCGLAVSQGITWFFDHVEAGIILEDDCLVSLSFFSFASELLEHYKNEPRVGHISALNWSTTENKSSYIFTEFAAIWGWATWKDRWLSYGDYPVKYNPEIVKDWVGGDFFRHFFYKKIFGYMMWDHQWIYTCIRNNYLSICPGVNLVENIGIGENATHLKSVENDFRFRNEASKMNGELIYPSTIELDLSTQETVLESQTSKGKYWYLSENIFHKILYKLKLHEIINI